jgi:hypothetical protein
MFLCILKGTTSIVVGTKAVSGIVRISAGRAKTGEGSVETEGTTEHSESVKIHFYCCLL